MSFQDVGKRNSNRQPVNAAMGSTSSVTMGMPSASSASAATSSVFASMSISASTATSQISDSLTQYHVRNPSKNKNQPSEMTRFLSVGEIYVESRVVPNRIESFRRSRNEMTLQESSRVE